MRKIIAFVIIICTSFSNSFASWPSDVNFTASAKTEGEYTVVTIRIPAGNKTCSFKVTYLSCFDGSSVCPGSTYITCYSNGQRYAGKLLGQRGDYKVNVSYNAYPNDLTYELCFERIPATITSIGVHLAYEYSNGWISNSSVATWDNLSVRQTFPSVPGTTLTSESLIKDCVDYQDDGIVGIYEGTVRSNKCKLACVKIKDEYKLVFVDGNTINSPWRIGEVKANLIPTATTGFFKAIWFMLDKRPNDNCYVTFLGSTMEVLLEGHKEIYIKMYPSASTTALSGTSQEWTGTGFALKNGYFVTNYHVIEGANTIKVRGIKGNSSISYNARVITSDKDYDLAVLKIDDNNFSGFGTVPYKVLTTTAGMGQSVYVLGYPLTQYLGDAIKLTNGIISSQTGYQDDYFSYQISAPVQPGNSGGPMFDEYGNIIGIVNAGIPGAENVGYAIKTQYLSSLLLRAGLNDNMPTANTIGSKTFTTVVKAIKPFVFFVECSSK